MLTLKKAAVYCLFVANLFIILVFWWWNNSASHLTFEAIALFHALGKLFGLLAVYFVLIQFLLIGRSFWIERTFGLDKLSSIHHINGQLSIVLILLHVITITAVYSAEAKNSFIQQFIISITSYEDVMQAFAALILFVFIVFFSIYIVRKRLKYEAWYFIHLFTYLAVFLAWGHQLKNGEDFLTNSLFTNYWYALYLFVFGNHLIFRFLRPFYLFRKHKFSIEKVVSETNDVTSVYIAGNAMQSFKIEPGQFMILRFLTKNLWWQAHPFSLSQIPNGKNLRVTIKNVGDFTSKVPELKAGTQIIVDGPFGTFTEKVGTKRKTFFIAGGIGITPIRSLMEQMTRYKKGIILFYGNKTKDEIVFFKEIEDLKRKFDFQIYYFLSQEKDENFLQGRIDKERIAFLVKDILDREIYLCGPVAMSEAIKKSLIEIGVKSSSIHYEKFSL